MIVRLVQIHCRNSQIKVRYQTFHLNVADVLVVVFREPFTFTMHDIPKIIARLDDRELNFRTKGALAGVLSKLSELGKVSKFLT